jgi:hypothetical protein
MKKFHQTRSGKLVKSVNADGQIGFLLNFDGKWYFRIYASKGKPEFTDYRLYHQDLQIQITDTRASFYTDADGNKWLDYSPRVLGLPRASKRSPKKTPSPEDLPSG